MGCFLPPKNLVGKVGRLATAPGLHNRFRSSRIQPREQPYAVPAGSVLPARMDAVAGFLVAWPETASEARFHGLGSAVTGGPLLVGGGQRDFPVTRYGKSHIGLNAATGPSDFQLTYAAIQNPDR